MVTDTLKVKGTTVNKTVKTTSSRTVFYFRLKSTSSMYTSVIFDSSDDGPIVVNILNFCFVLILSILRYLLFLNFYK